MSKILVVAVHPDDETLGAGGTLQRHKSNGDVIHWLIMTAQYFRDGSNALHTFDSKGDEVPLPNSWQFPTGALETTREKVFERADEIRRVAEAFSFDSVTEMLIPATGIAAQSEACLINSISRVFSEIRPETVYLPFYSDVHGDHQAAFLACYRSAKTFRTPSVRNIYMMETISETEYAVPFQQSVFIPNRFVNIDKWLDRKMKILKIYSSEIADPPMPRNEQSIRALALLRGTFAQCRFAEAFMVVREIV